MAPTKNSMTPTKRRRGRKTVDGMTQISISLSHELVGGIDKCAKEQNRNRSNYIAWVMRKVVEGKFIILADGTAEDYNLVRK